MSHRNVERVIGRMVTDEAFRRRFAQDPAAAIQEIIAGGMELTACEVGALATIDPDRVARLAEAIDARIQKSDLGGGPR